MEVASLCLSISLSHTRARKTPTCTRPLFEGGRCQGCGREALRFRVLHGRHPGVRGSRARGHKKKSPNNSFSFPPFVCSSVPGVSAHDFYFFLNILFGFCQSLFLFFFSRTPKNKKQPTNFLNTLGRRPDGSGGDILLWKRKAERCARGKQSKALVHAACCLLLVACC